MKAKDLRRIQREADAIRRETGLPRLDVQRLMAIDRVRDAILQTAKKAEKRREGGNSD